MLPLFVPKATKLLQLTSPRRELASRCGPTLMGSPQNPIWGGDGTIRGGHPDSVVGRPSLRPQALPQHG